MRFAPPQRRRPPEAIVPMINVVFLLLIFFLMSAQIAPPDPFALDLPAADQDMLAEGQAVLMIAADGTPAMAGETGTQALAALAELPPDTQLTIRADRGLEAAELARLMQRLAQIGLRDVELAVRP